MEYAATAQIAIVMTELCHEGRDSHVTSNVAGVMVAQHNAVRRSRVVIRNRIANIVIAGRARSFRTLFISDVHLGTKGCQADRLLDFLRHHDADTIYLVGDIVDGWQLRSSWYWPQAHKDVVQKFLRQARKGVSIVYVPGNHDEFLRDYYGVHFGGVEVVEHAVHTAGDGRRYLVIHGDHFDLVVTQAPWLAQLGSRAYDVAIAVNRVFNALRRRLGFPYWSLSQWAKLKVKNAVNYISEFERTLADEALRHAVDGGDLRSHPSRRDSRRFRRSLRELRRLGRELQRHRRAFRRPARGHELDRRDAQDEAEREGGGTRGGARRRNCRLSALAGRGAAALPSGDATIARSRLADRRRRRCRGAAACGRCATHAAGDVAGARCAHGRARVPQGGNPAAHGLVQVPRRLQQALLHPAGGTRGRRGGVLLGQSRAGGCGGGAPPRHAGGHRHAGGCAAPQARAYRGAGRRGRALRPRAGRPPGHRAGDRAEAPRRAGAAL